jgi:hypothetical protein
MKKLVLLFAIIALFIGSVQAQTIKVGGGDNWKQFQVKSTDVLDADGESIEKIFYLGDKENIQYYSVFFDIDTVLRPGVLMAHYIPVSINESYDGINYTALQNVNFYGTADTTFTISDLSTGSIAPYLKVILSGVDADSVNVQLMKCRGRFINK